MQVKGLRKKKLVLWVVSPNFQLGLQNSIHMSEPILDDFQENEPPRFANKSYRMLNAGVGFYFLLILLHLFYWHPIAEGHPIGFLTLVAGLAGSTFTLIGIYFGVKSVKKKEKGGRKNYFSMYGSVIVFLMMGWVTLQYIFDLFSFLNSIK